MITKSRLEELIKQGATVYCADRDVQFPIPIFLNEEDFVKKEDLSHKENCVRDNIPLEDLYETHKQAEWALKYQRIPNTEYLDLPMWEEIEDTYVLEFGNSRLEVDKTNDKIWVLTDKNHYLGLYRFVFNELATEENYIKACNVALKLFKGENNDK